MGKIGDLFVKLGLKNSEFKKGMAEAKAETEGFGGKIKAVGAKAVAIWATIGAVAAKFALDFVKSTQKLGDAWDVAMSRCKAGWSQFVNSLTQWNWEGFGQRMKNAMDAAGALTAVKDMTFEVQNSIDIRKAKMREYLEELQRQARDQRLTDEERAAAARKYLDAVKPLYNEELAMREKLRDAYSDKFLGDAGVGGGVRNRELLETFLTEVAPNGTLLNALEQYAKKAQGKKNYTLTQEDNDAIDAFLNRYAYGEQGVLLSLANYYQNGIGGKDRDQKVKDIVNGIKDYYAAEGAFLAETRRMQNMEASMLSRVDGGAVDTSGVETSAPTDPMLDAIREEIDALEALAAETEEVTDASDAMYERWRLMHGLPPIEEVIDPDIADIIQQADKNLQQFGRDLEKTEKDAVDLKELLTMGVNSAVQGFSDALQEMFDQLFSLDEGDADAVFAALLKPLAETAKKMGEIMLAAGIGMTAFGEALKNPDNAPLLIAAGAALIAIGAAASAALSSLAGGGSASSAAGTATTSTASGAAENMEMTIHIEGKLKGSDIVLAGQRTQTAWGR